MHKKMQNALHSKPILAIPPLNATPVCKLPARRTMRGRALADDRTSTPVYRCHASERANLAARGRYLATIIFPCDKFCVRAFATRRAERFGRPFPDTVNL
jgi:hypothetical protein